MEQLTIHAVDPNTFKGGAISVPGSKSYSNRALLIAALAKGESVLKNILISNDTKVMIQALKDLGVKIKIKNTTVIITGCNGQFKKPKNKLYIENAGTAIRFLTTALAIQDFECIITGNERMQNRPIKDLVDALKQGGANIEYLEKDGFPPLKINGGFKGGVIKVNGDVSSQYISSLLISSPYTKKETIIKTIGIVTSTPYIDMTIQIMKDFGTLKLDINEYKQMTIQNKNPYKGINYEIEADASSASYFFALGAIHNVKITVKNAKYNSMQGDIKFVDILEQAGCEIIKNKEKGITVIGPKKLNILGTIDMNSMPDVSLTMAIVAAFTKGKTRLINIPNLKVKECDRIFAMTTQLNKVNCKAKQMAAGIEIKGNPEKYHKASINTYNDHRIAMCFGILGSKVDKIIIENPNCVSKTYPKFWEDLKKLGIKIT